MRQRVILTFIIVTFFALGLVGTLRWQAGKRTEQQVDRILQLTSTAGGPSAAPGTTVPAGITPTGSTPAPRVQPEDPRSSFTPVTVVRVPTPASWSTNPAVVQMRKYLQVGRIREAEAALRAATTRDATTEYYAGVFDAELGRRDNAIYHLSAARADARLVPYAQGIMDVYPFYDAFSDGPPEFLDTLVSRALLANGEVEIARDKLRFVTKNYAGYTDAWMLLGAAELLLGHPQQAEEDLRRTLPTSKAEAYYWLGLATSSQGKYDDAIAAFRQALSRGATPAYRIVEKVAESALATGDATQAAQSYEQALSACLADPSCPAVELTVRPVWVNLEYLKRPERALELAQQTLVRNPRSAMAENLVAWSMLRLRRFDEADQHIRAALTLDPSLAAAHLNAGTLAWLRNDLGEAKREFLRASQLDAEGSVGVQARKNLTVIEAPSTP